MAGKIPCIGRTDVGFDYRVGRAAAEHGDVAVSRRLAHSLGRFAVQHIGYTLAGAITTAVHIANIKSGGTIHALEAVYAGIYTLAQTSFVHTQATLSRKLYEKSDAAEQSVTLLAPVRAQPDIVTPSSLVEVKPYTAPERPTPPVRDRIFTAATQGAFGLTALHGAVELASAISEQF
jgi:hypothetical protein